MVPSGASSSRSKRQQLHVIALHVEILFHAFGARMRGRIDEHQIPAPRLSC